MALSYSHQWVDVETVSNNYTSATGTLVSGVGKQNFQDMYGLGEYATLLSIYDRAVYAMGRRWASNPIGPKWGGYSRPWQNNGANLDMYPDQGMMDMPDIVSRIDPNRIWVRGQETLTHDIYNSGNTVAYVKVYTYVPKVVHAQDASTVQRSTLMDVVPYTTTWTYFGVNGVTPPPTAWAWAYPNADVAATTDRFIFYPRSYINNTLWLPRFFGAMEQLAGLGQWFRPDLRQDLAANAFHAAATNAVLSGAGAPYVAETYFGTGRVETPVTGPPNYSFPGTFATQWRDADYRSFWMGGQSTHYTQPGDYKGGGYGNSTIDSSAVANEYPYPNAKDGSGQQDYSHWPQYNEKYNRFLRKVFVIKERRLVIPPGERRVLKWRGRPFMVNAVRDRLICHTDMRPQTVTNDYNADDLTGNAEGSLYLQGASFRAAINGSNVLGKTTLPDTLMLRRHGSPTTTMPISYCVRGQHGIDTTQPNSMNIMPAVLVVKKTLTARFNARTVAPPRMNSTRTVYDNRSNKPLTTTGTPNYAITFPVTTTGQLNPTWTTSAYP